MKLAASSRCLAAAFMRPLHPRRVNVELGAKRRLKSALSDAKKPKRATKKASAPVRSLDEEIAKRERPQGVAVGDYLESLRSAETAAAEAIDLSKQAAALADDSAPPRRRPPKTLSGGRGRGGRDAAKKAAGGREAIAREGGRGRRRLKREGGAGGRAGARPRPRRES